MNAPFPIDPVLTAIAIAYRNKTYIADDVLPRVPVAKQEFKYRKFPKADAFTIPNTFVGRTSRPNQVEFGFTEAADFTRAYGLDDPIPHADVANAPEGHDPAAHAAETLSNIIATDREARVAGLVFDPNQYDTANKATLTGTDQWSDFDNSNPIADILGALDKCIMRPNIMVLGNAVWTQLRQHPKIAKATHGNSGDVAVVARQAVAELLELEAIFVGQAFVNTAKRGQEVSVERAWGKHVALIYRDTLANTQSGTTFGFTAQWGDRIAGTIPDPNLGLEGGTVVRVGENVKELITANDLGYFFQDAVA